MACLGAHTPAPKAAPATLPEPDSRRGRADRRAEGRHLPIQAVRSARKDGFLKGRWLALGFPGAGGDAMFTAEDLVTALLRAEVKGVLREGGKATATPKGGSLGPPMTQGSDGPQCWAAEDAGAERATEDSLGGRGRRRRPYPSGLGRKDATAEKGRLSRLRKPGRGQM